MATIKALCWPGVTLPSGHVIAFGDPVQTENETLRSGDNARVLPVLIAAGQVAVEYDPDSEPEAARVDPVEPTPAPIETPAEPVEDAPAKTLKGA